MNTKTHSPARDLVLAALFLALAFVLPMITGHVPQVGNMLCPMHFPVLLAGFVLGGPWGLALGFLAPLLRSVLFGMPPLYPIAIAMAFELATYGAVAGWMYKKVRHTLPMMYAALVTAMVAGRLVWGAVRFVLAGLSGSAFPFSAFLSGALLTAIPGIIAQYRYRFAIYNLCENPEIGVLEAINMSKAQTAGFKGTLFVLDLSFLGWSILCWLTLGILNIWIAPYKEQANVGYFQEIKKVKGIGYQPPQDGGEDDEFHPIDPFGPSY